MVDKARDGSECMECMECKSDLIVHAAREKRGRSRGTRVLMYQFSHKVTKLSFSCPPCHSSKWCQMALNGTKRRYCDL